jgi:hypothetical protein
VDVGGWPAGWHPPNGVEVAVGCRADRGHTAAADQFQLKQRDPTPPERTSFRETTPESSQHESDADQLD